MGPRSAKLKLKAKGNEVVRLAGNTTSFNYTDVASGSSDSISVTLEDIDIEWIDKFNIVNGDKITADIVMKNWNGDDTEETFKCGSFTVDDMSISGRPCSLDLGGVSVPAKDSFKTSQHSKTWEGTTIKEIASSICKASKIDLYYDAPSINIGSAEQSNETDSKFLLDICNEYGLAMKIFRDKVIIFDETEAEKKDSVVTFKESDFVKWSYTAALSGTYTGIKLTYKASTKNTITYQTGSTDRLYSYSTKVSGTYDAELKAKAKLRELNKNAITMTATIMANPNIVASSMVDVTKMGKMSGRYYVDKVVHSLGNGYAMQLTLRRVGDLKKKKKSKGLDDGSGNQKYIVVKGDTLWGIAKTYYGNGSKWTVIYDANKKVIEDTARARGLADSDNGHWIFPGEQLVIPTLEGGSQ